MTCLRTIPPDSQSPSPPRSYRYRLIIAHCIAYAVPAILALLMVVFLAIPALMPPEFRLHSASSLSSLNISDFSVGAQWDIALSVKNPSKLISVKYTHMKLLLSFDSRLPLSRPSCVPAFTQGPCNVTTVRTEVLSKVEIVNDLSVKGLVSNLNSGLVAIDVVVKAKRRLNLGLCWVPIFNVHFSCMDVTFTAPTDSKDGSDWPSLGGTLNCLPDIITQL